jgi:hypothetical protein
MSQTIKQLEERFPWQLSVLRDNGIVMGKISDITEPQMGDMALGEDGLVYCFVGGDWR